MHSRLEIGIYSYYDVVKYRRSLGNYLNLDNFLVGNACCSCLLGSEMNMSFCNDNSLVKIYLSARPYKLAGCRAFDISALTDGRGYAERSCVGKRYLNLRRFSCRTEYAYSLDLVFRSDNGYSFLASELTGLA